MSSEKSDTIIKTLENSVITNEKQTKLLIELEQNNNEIEKISENIETKSTGSIASNLIDMKEFIKLENSLSEMKSDIHKVLRIINQLDKENSKNKSKNEELKNEIEQLKTSVDKITNQSISVPQTKVRRTKNDDVGKDRDKDKDTIVSSFGECSRSCCNTDKDSVSDAGHCDNKNENDYAKFKKHIETVLSDINLKMSNQMNVLTTVLKQNKR